MLEQLYLRDIQCHERQLLDLNYPIVSFVGHSDKGKSAILRALKWICLNQPAGDELLRDDAEFAYGRTTFEGRRIIRKKGSGHNSYRLGDKEFNALGYGGVPTEIAQLLNLTEDNFQDQLDGPFWFNLSPGDLSKELNRIINLGLIDKVISLIRKDQNEANSTIRIVNQRVQEAKRRKTELAWVPAADKALLELEELQEQHETTIQEMESLAVLLQEVEVHETTLGNLGSIKEEGRKILRIGDQAFRVQQDINELEAIIQEIEKHEPKLNAPDITALDKLRQHADAVAEERRELDLLIEDLEKAEEELCSLQTTLAQQKSLLDQYQTKICPTCEQPLPQSPSATSTTTPFRRRSGART